MPPVGRYREVLSKLDRKPVSLKLKPKQKLAHERRYLYDQAKRLGFKIAVLKTGQHEISVQKVGKPKIVAKSRRTEKSKS